MARIRTIKPEFFTNSKITKLTPLARLFYVSLWCEADRAGRLKWDADTLKDRYLPRDKADVDDIGNALARSGLIRFYQVNGVLYIDIPGFLEHQVINNRESESSNPPYSDDACVTRESGVSDAACGKEGRKGREGKEGTPPVVPKGDGTYSADFERWWETYPNKVGKDAAWRAWQKAFKRVDLQTLIDAAKRYVATKPADREWCNPSKWLNQGRWQDAPATPQVAVDNTAPPEDMRWKLRVEGFDRSGFWNRDHWGPAPNEPGCKAPTSLLAARSPPNERRSA